MDANKIKEIEASNPTAGKIELINRWREIVKLMIYRLTGGKWKRYLEPKLLRNVRKVIEERLQQIIKNRETADLRQRISPKQTGRISDKAINGSSFLCVAGPWFVVCFAITFLRSDL